MDARTLPHPPSSDIELPAAVHLLEIVPLPDVAIGPVGEGCDPPAVHVQAAVGSEEAVPQQGCVVRCQDDLHIVPVNDVPEDPLGRPVMQRYIEIVHEEVPDIPKISQTHNVSFWTVVIQIAGRGCVVHGRIGS